MKMGPWKPIKSQKAPKVKELLEEVGVAVRWHTGRDMCKSSGSSMGEPTSFFL